MDRFDAMNVLLAVVEEGSISAGARRLRAPLATVSRKVSDLESYLRTSLLVRTSRRIELTEAGRDYVAAAKRIMDQVDEAEQTAAGEYREPRGELLFTAPVSFGQQHVLPVVLEFLKAHPLIDMRITFADRRVNLIEEQIHVALRIGELDDNNLIATRVGEVRLATFASPAYLDSAGVPQTPEDLKDFDGISTVGWRFQRGGRNLFVEPRSRVVLNTEDSCVKAAIAGLGVARALQTHVEPWLASGDVVEILQDFALPGVPVSLIYPKQGMMPLKLRAFLNYVAPRLRTTLKK